MKSELLSSSSVKEFIEGDWEAVFAAPDAIAPHFQDEPGNGEQIRVQMKATGRPFLQLLMRLLPILRMNPKMGSKSV